MLIPQNSIHNEQEENEADPPEENEVIQTKNIASRLRCQLQKLDGHIKSLEGNANNLRQLQQVERLVFQKIGSYLKDVEDDQRARKRPKTWHANENTMFLQ